jgi:hypothetical protein
MLGMVLTFLLMTSGLGGLAWVIGRRLTAHAQAHPEAVRAWLEHVVRPALTPAPTADDYAPKGPRP